MELTVKDRLYIPALLPKQGNFRQFNMKKEILRKIEISDKEREELQLKENEETKRIEWDTEKDIPLNVELLADEIEFLKTCCEKLADEELPDDMWATVEKVYDAMQEN